MRLALVFLAACWSGYVDAPVPPKPRTRVQTLPSCWTQEFYEAVPQRAWLWEVTSQCEADWPSDQIDAVNCAAIEIDRHYARLWEWVWRWWESCVPVK